MTQQILDEGIARYRTRDKVKSEPSSKNVAVKEV